MQSSTQLLASVWSTGVETGSPMSVLYHQWCRITPVSAPRKYHEAMFHMLHDDYGHQGLDQTLALVRRDFIGVWWTKT